MAVENEAQFLSKILFESREQIAMWADVVATHTGVRDPYVDGLRDRIDKYRRLRGWSPDGFGGER